MKSKQYIISAIDNMSDVFPQSTYSYEFYSSSNTHFIDVQPFEFYLENNDFQMFQSSIILEFIEKFPLESVCFISDDSIFKIKEPIYVKKASIISDCNLTLESELFEIALSENYVDLTLDYSDIEILNSKAVNNRIEQITLSKKPSSHSNFLNLIDISNFSVPAEHQNVKNFDPNDLNMAA